MQTIKLEYYGSEIRETVDALEEVLLTATITYLSVSERGIPSEADRDNVIKVKELIDKIKKQTNI